MFNDVLRYLVLIILYCVLPAFEGRGLLLLYRPRDVTNDCANSEKLRFDLSFGMGMSDTITLVFRTLSEVDYECAVDIATEKEIPLLIVIKYPNAIGFNCDHNPQAFIIQKGASCISVCETILFKEKTTYFTMGTRSRFRFRFTSNSSLNTEMEAHLYEVTVTAARHMSETATGVCNKANETECEIDSERYCFTLGVVCDGIKNCGVPDWFDERKTDCEMPVEKMGRAAVAAVAAAIGCAVLAATHITAKCLPPKANSYFIFNVNEDNRLCIEPILRVTDGARPVESSSSSSSTEDNGEVDQAGSVSEANNPSSIRKGTVKTVTQKIQEKIKLVTSRNKNTTGSDTEANTSSYGRSKSIIA